MKDERGMKLPQTGSYKRWVKAGRLAGRCVRWSWHHPVTATVGFVLPSAVVRLYWRHLRQEALRLVQESYEASLRSLLAEEKGVFDVKGWSVSREGSWYVVSFTFRERSTEAVSGWWFLVDPKSKIIRPLRDNPALYHRYVEVPAMISYLKNSKSPSPTPQESQPKRESEEPVVTSIPAILASPSTYQGRLLRFKGLVGTATPLAQVLILWDGTLEIYVNYGSLSATDREQVLRLGANSPVEVIGRINSGPAGLEIQATAIE